MYGARAAALLATALYISCAVGITFNVTIDDTAGDALTGETPTYLNAPGPKTWHARPLVDPCPGCTVNPDPTRMKMNTWHDGMSLTASLGSTAQTNSVSFGFTGTAVYIYCVLVNNVAAAIADTHVLFSIDGDQVGAFDHTQVRGQETFMYNHLVYSNQTISMGRHEFTMSSRQGTNSLILFDYALYTTSDDSASPSSAQGSLSVSTIFETLSGHADPPSSTPLAPSETSNDAASSSARSNISIATSPATAPTSTLSQVTTSSMSSTSTSKPPSNQTGKATTIRVAIIAASTAIGVALLALLLWLCTRRSRRAAARRLRVSTSQRPGILAVMGLRTPDSTTHPFVVPILSSPIDDVKTDSMYWTLDRDAKRMLHFSALSTEATLAARSPATDSAGMLDSALMEVAWLRDEVERLRGSETAAPGPPTYETSVRPTSHTNTSSTSQEDTLA
ncbi:hypothetical protein EXIGLDRAFT_753387 [Exidia glandulosa HHB12029]|uniref:CBM6 domain-containing protein n=1 Tax=Exidia glandulosa HHB12029 TaxID=1314781 RepID=A0A165DTS4_EXIGL|nr:hypothetical protein EXIGLDRAFT_753387 [Exidia glandulosa HHB12029]